MYVLLNQTWNFSVSSEWYPKSEGLEIISCEKTEGTGLAWSEENPKDS